MLLVEHEMLHFVGSLFVLVTQAIDVLEAYHRGFASADTCFYEFLIDDRRFHDVVRPAKPVAVGPDRLAERGHEADPHQQEQWRDRHDHDAQGGVEKETVHVLVSASCEIPGDFTPVSAVFYQHYLAASPRQFVFVRVLVWLSMKMRRYRN